MDHPISLTDAGALVRIPMPAGEDLVALADAIGRVLARPISADRPFPPYRRAMMDGIAFAADTLPKSGPLVIEGLHAAGDPPPPALPAGRAWEIMTGALVPEDCDTVVPYEDLRDGRPPVGFLKGQHIHGAGSDAAEGTVLLEAGQVLGPVEVAIAASVGIPAIPVVPRARVAILSTGDEAVAPDAVPRAWEIRRSNGPMLEAMLRRRGHVISFHDHAPDDADACGAMMDAALATCDVLLVCGGISRGKKDHVRALLEARLGVPAFHGVLQRPGKPLAYWAGPPAVFALPGNPVSVLATFTRHVLPALARAEGQVEGPPQVTLSAAVDPLPSLARLLPVRRGAGGEMVPRPPTNSGDFISVAGACGLVEIPPGRTDRGPYDYYPFP